MATRFFKQQFINPSIRPYLTRSLAHYNSFEFQHFNKAASDEPNQFWYEQSKSIPWITPPKLNNILDQSEDPLFRWFPNTVMNTSYCCLDHQVLQGRGKQPALIHHNSYASNKDKETTTFTYEELLSEVSKFAGALASRGVEKGDLVVIYMPMIPEAIIAMLACARLGALHSVVFGGFASKELSTRIRDAEPKAIVSASYGNEPGKIIAYRPLLQGAFDILKETDNESDWNVNDISLFMYNRPEVDSASRGLMDHRKILGEIDMRDEMTRAQPHEAVPVNGTDPLYVLYTSGTTGHPKGVVRENGGHAVALKYTMDSIYAAPPGSVFFSASDIGWIVGHSYIGYAPFLQGCTSVLFEGKPIGTPDAGEYWRVCEKYGVETIFTAPTALRAIKQHDPDLLLKDKYDLSGLRAVFVAGERADPPTLKFFIDKLKKPLIDHWWQTETGWPITALPLGLLPSPAVTKEGETSVPVKLGSSGFAVPGYHVVCLDTETGQEVQAGELGQLAVKLPMPPGTLPFLFKSKERYKSSYLDRFPGYYDCGDSGYIDEEGYVYVMSRTDDVINVAGHRLSTGQMEEVLQGHDAIAECCVVGVNDPIKGMLPVGIVVLNNNQSEDTIKAECVQLIRKEVGPVAAFKTCLVVKALPKARSGKILRRTIKAILDGVPNPPVPPTIDNIEVLDYIHEAKHRLTK